MSDAIANARWNHGLSTLFMPSSNGQASMRIPHQESTRGVVLEPDMRCVDAEQCLAPLGQSQFEQYKFVANSPAVFMLHCSRVPATVNGRDNGRTMRSLRNVARTLCACLLVGLDIAPALAGTPAPVPVAVAQGVYALMGQRRRDRARQPRTHRQHRFRRRPARRRRRRQRRVVPTWASDHCRGRARHPPARYAPSSSRTRPGSRVRRRGVPGPGHSGIDAPRRAALMAARCEACLRTLGDALGARTMAGSRVVKPDRLVTKTKSLDLIGRPLTLMAPARRECAGRAGGLRSDDANAGRRQPRVDR